MAAPTVRAVGAIANGVGAITPGAPAGSLQGDLWVMFLETADEAITVTGWTQLPTHSPQSVSGVTRLTVFYKIVDDPATDNRATSDSGDHQIGRIVGINVGTYNRTTPINISAGGTRTPASTTATIPGGTTTVDDCLVLAASSHELDQTAVAFSGWTNAALTGLAEIIDNSAADGNGGGIGVASGVKATAGAIGNTTATVTSSRGGMISLAIAPAAGASRTTQVVAEAAILPDVATARTTQVVAEAAILSDDGLTRVTQVVAEVIFLPSNAAQVTQVVAEVIWKPTPTFKPQAIVY